MALKVKRYSVDEDACCGGATYEPTGGMKSIQALIDFLTEVRDQLNIGPDACIDVGYKVGYKVELSGIGMSLLCEGEDVEY